MLSLAWKDWERKASNFPPEVAFQLYSFHWFSTKLATYAKIIYTSSPSLSLIQHETCFNKTPAQAFTTPADEKKMGTIWIFVYYAVYSSGRGRCRDFLVLKWGGGLNLQIWDLNRAHETERTVFPILQVFSMCRCKL